MLASNPDAMARREREKKRDDKTSEKEVNGIFTSFQREEKKKKRNDTQKPNIC